MDYKVSFVAAIIGVTICDQILKAVPDLVLKY
jgi:hypothetical protein